MEPFSKTKYGQAIPAPADPVERRTCPRYPFSPEVEVVDVQSVMRLRARLSDISRNGCYVDTINPLAKDSAVTLTITRDNLSFKTQAKVVYSNVGMGMGLLFTTAEPHQLQVLGKWLSELSNRKAADHTPSNLPHRTQAYARRSRIAPGCYGPGCSTERKKYLERFRRNGSFAKAFQVTVSKRSPHSEERFRLAVRSSRLEAKKCP
jgi:PilZ domain